MSTLGVSACELGASSSFMEFKLPLFPCFHWLNHNLHLHRTPNLQRMMWNPFRLSAGPERRVSYGSCICKPYVDFWIYWDILDDTKRLWVGSWTELHFPESSNGQGRWLHAEIRILVVDHHSRHVSSLTESPCEELEGKFRLCGIFRLLINKT